MTVELCALIAFACAALVGIITYKRREKIAENWRKRQLRKGRNDKSYEGMNDHIGLNVFGRSFLALIGTFLVLECTVGRHNGMWNEEMESAYGEIEVIFSHPQLLVIGAFTVALYILEFIWFSKMLDKNKEVWNRKKEEAIAAGKTALASKKSQSYDRDSHDERVYHATYVYEIGGKKYKYGCHFRSDPPHTLQVYYRNNPARAFSGYDDHTVYFNLLGPVLFIFPIACTYLVLKLLGIDMEWLASI